MGEVTRAEHMAWCKQRAREYLAANNPQEAVTSMLSDLRKHPETADMGQTIAALGMFSMRSLADARKFVEGFPE